MKPFLSKHKSVIILYSFIIFSLFNIWFSGQTTIVTPKIFGMAFFSFFQGISASLSTFIGNSINSVQQLSDLRYKYDDLLLKLQKYEEQRLDVGQLINENNRLKKILEISSSLNIKNIPAQIIGKDPGVIFSTITINKGFNNGVCKGMSVIAIQDGKQGLVGKVQFVGPTSSQILPIFDSQNFISGRLEKSRYEGLISGSGTSLADLRMNYIDLDAKRTISVGDDIITSGLNSIYPPNLYIGTVTTIQTKQYESSLELSVHPFIKFSKLEYIFLINIMSESLQ